MNKKYYLPTVLFLSIICTTQQLTVFLITTIVFTKNVSTAGKRTKITFHNKGHVERIQSKKVTTFITTSKNFLKIG